jgi:hypothetical protein
MSSSPKEDRGGVAAVATVEAEDLEPREGRELYLRDGRKLVVSEQGADSLVEVRGASGLLEVRIRLTEEGPVLQLDAARLQLRASEAVEIASPRVAITGTEQVEVAGGAVKVHAEEEMDLEAKGDVRVVGKMIWLN